MAGLERPLLVYDGDCGFCMRWAQRWRRQTAGRVDYASSHSAAERFPAAEVGRVPAADFQASVVLFEPGGRISRGAEAVFRSLSSLLCGRMMLAAYRFVPGARPLTEWGYGLVARKRELFSKLDALLVGRDVVLSSYASSRRMFLAGLALVAAIAFVSLGVQVQGLIGSTGIVPVAEWLPLLDQQLGGEAVWRAPTLLWLDSSDAMLGVLCWGGALLSLLLLLDIAPALCLALMTVAYLSLTHASARFLAFQWDTLLIEMLVLGIWLAPWRFKRGTPAVRAADPPPPVLARWLLWFLVFRFMFESGVVKLTSGDASWSDLTALSFHYWTQPLPHGLSWTAAHLPLWLHKFSAAMTFVAELGLPLLVFAPRRLRHLSALGMIGLQVAIAATGNYGFFNLATTALCLFLLDDQWWQRWSPWCRQPSEATAQDPVIAPGDAAAGSCGLAAPGELPPWSLPRPERLAKRVLLPVFACVVFAIGALQLRDLWVEQPRLQAEQIEAGVLPTLAEDGLAAAAQLLEWHLYPFRVVNSYGLFRVMTKTRPEIRIQGSATGMGPGGEWPDDWIDYDFRWKPDDPAEVPGWCQPHMPRLDWLLWFDALAWEPATRGRSRPFEGSSELYGLMTGLLIGEPAILDLLGENPFADSPPRSVRAQLWDYRLTTPGERDRSGEIWVATPLDTRGLTYTRRD